MNKGSGDFIFVGTFRIACLGARAVSVRSFAGESRARQSRAGEHVAAFRRRISRKPHLRNLRGPISNWAVATCTERWSKPTATG